jgi:lysosomal-associated membrane protein 1/2
LFQYKNQSKYKNTRMMLKILVLFLSIAAICYAQNDTTVATTQADTTTKQADTTTKQADTTTSAATTEEPATTQEPVTTTVAPSIPSVLNFTIPPNKAQEDVCLVFQFAVMMNIEYRAQKDNIQSNVTLSVPLPKDYDTYNGTCDTNLNTFTLTFWKQWELEMAYLLKDTKYELSRVKLTYNVDKKWFPNAVDEGVRTIEVTDLHQFPANKGNSYKCNAKTTLALGSDVTFDITNYQAEPFFGDKNKYKGVYDIAVDCPADTQGTSKLVPIIVGSALAFLIVLVLIAYLIGRRRHRSGYQTV